MLLLVLYTILTWMAVRVESSIVSTEFDVVEVDAGDVVDTVFPPFANAGGPADLSGALYQQESGYIGMILPSGGCGCAR